MDQKGLNYLTQCLDQFIVAAIVRMGENGEPEQVFHLPVADITKNVGTLTSDEIKEFFSKHGINVDHDQDAQLFRICVNLLTFPLNPQQANLFAHAKQRYHS